MVDVKIDPRYVEGIMFNDTKAYIPSEKDSEGKRKIRYEKVSRKLFISDILSFKELESEVCFVTADGKKYTKPKLSKAGG